jgi:hypothetical protein
LLRKILNFTSLPGGHCRSVGGLATLYISLFLALSHRLIPVASIEKERNMEGFALQRIDEGWDSLGHSRSQFHHDDHTAALMGQPDCLGSARAASRRPLGLVTGRADFFSQ